MFKMINFKYLVLHANNHFPNELKKTCKVKELLFAAFISI